MFNWNVRHLQPEEVHQEVNQRGGFIPVDIDLENSRLVWMDLGDYHLSESFFFLSTKKLMQDKKGYHAFTSELSVLDSESILPDFIYPTGFIFHMGRCGSTLLSKALARSPQHLVISEAPPHFLIWTLLTENFSKPLDLSEKNKRRYRNLILSTGRKRFPEYHAHFVKFTTFNILFLDFIRSVFPDVPIVFLYRNPAEVMVAFADQGPGWQHLKNTAFGAFVAGCSLSEVQTMGYPSFHEHFLSRFMTVPLHASPQGLTLLNYNQLKPRLMASFLKMFNYKVDTEELERMQAQFDYHAKEDDRPKKFVPDTAEKQRKITPEIEALVSARLKPLYDKLEKAVNNYAQY